MSETYRQTISDELAQALDARRGLLSRQEFTTLALVAAIEQPAELAALRQELAELRAQVASVRAAPAPPPAAPGACAIERLSF